MLASWILFLSLSTLACGPVEDSMRTAQSPDEHGPSRAASSAVPSVLRLRKAAVHDPALGRDALTLLVPEGWKVEGGVRWQLEYSNLATAAIVVRDPQSPAALELFPTIPGCWHDSGRYGSIAPGQNYMGNVVARPPVDLVAFTRDVVIPQFRPSARVVKSDDLPAVARAVEKNAAEPGVSKRAHAARIRLEYDAEEKSIAEDLFLTVVLSTSPAVPGSTIWSMEHAYSFRAEKERLDALAPLFQAMSSSVRLELPWFAGYSQVFAKWQQGQLRSIRAAGELSRAISDANDAMLATMRPAHEKRQAAQDRAHREFSESIRGTDHYADPFAGREVELPSGYTDVWASASGGYVFSNTAGYDPNVGATIEWRKLEPTR